ncbi:biliverdin-producing heme oxygenase [Mucilaginibacter arboris]|uniref:Heme oxygenase n=1 Tax=Mucilaginibacter arboris TaxID=2682090 RepID=A0A7K1T161_9SPHI|nr:biliverdin-producing heme oxygenase [Mucilaginibacter arboris]MVN23267.1 hypothetical protein [Mucilaginibacter arboris]
MLQEVLKQATSKQHHDLEQLMLVDKIMNGTLSAEEYQKILQTNYIIHACFEQQLFESLDQNLQNELNINNRIKLPALLKDLQELDIDAPETEFNSKNLILIGSNAAVLGAMYVLEGATLGGNVIVKKLKVNANLQKFNLGFHYYQVYAASLITNWKNFLQVLNTRVDASAYNQSIRSALTLFEYFMLVQNKQQLSGQSIS